MRSSPNRPSRVVPACPTSLALVLLLGSGVPGCPLFDLLSALYTGTYAEFAGGCFGEEDYCQEIDAVYGACLDEKGIADPDCQSLRELLLDCAYCDRGPGGAILFSASQNTSASTVAQPEVFWSAGDQQILRTDGGGIYRLFDAARYPLGIDVDAAAGKVYWTDGRTNSLRRSNLDGTVVEDLVTDLYGSGVAIDQSVNVAYYGNITKGQIGRINLTTLIHDVVVDGVFNPVDLVVDPQSGFIYWTQVDENGDGSVQWFDPAAGGTPATIASGLSLPFGLTIDSGSGNLYFSEFAGNAIRRLRIGDATIVDVLTGLDQPSAVSVNPTTNTIYWSDAGSGALRRADLSDPATQRLR